MAKSYKSEEYKKAIRARQDRRDAQRKAKREQQRMHYTVQASDIGGHYATC